jgi:hypothetical protein
MDLWHSNGSFPIHFHKIDGIKDQTQNAIDLLNSQTSTLNFIFNFIRDNSISKFYLDIQAAYKAIVNFLENIGPRGVLTILGVRTTPGSCETFLPKKSDLIKQFNFIYKVLSFNLEKRRYISGRLN